MDLQDLKIYALNGMSLMMSFSNIETTLKILLLIISIGYTVSKWYKLHKRDDGTKNK